MSCSLLSLPEPSTVPGKQWTLFINREKTGFTPTLPGREGRREGSEGAGRRDHSFSSSTLLARSKVTDLRGGRHSNLVPLPAPRLCAREGGAASRAGLQRSAHWGLRGPGEARAEKLGRRTPRGARRERTASPLLLVTGFPKSAQTWEGRAGTPLQSSSISGAAPPGPSSSFQHSRCPGKTQSLAAAGPVYLRSALVPALRLRRDRARPRCARGSREPRIRCLAAAAAEPPAR